MSVHLLKTLSGHLVKTRECPLSEDTECPPCEDAEWHDKPLSEAPQAQEPYNLSDTEENES